MSWYRTYRPTALAELHLTKVREELIRLVNSGHLPHALLLAGPRGTGKTSAARILAAIVNDPQNQPILQNFFPKDTNKKTKKNVETPTFSEPDINDDLTQRILKGTAYAVQEIDAASYRGIDDIRQLKERAVLPPTEGQLSVYILDEVHMLTAEAFNALLKLLEEPPAHVMFILATTELQKIPATIVSRCLLIPFERATPDELRVALERILRAEQMTFEAEAVMRIAEAADGSFRDAVKLLESLAAGTTALTLQLVETSIHQPVLTQIKQLVTLIVEKEEKAVVQLFQQLRQQQTDQSFFFRQLLSYLHGELVSAIQTGVSELAPKISLYLLQQLQPLPLQSPHIPFLALETKALELILKAKEKQTPTTSQSSSSSQSMSMEKKPVMRASSVVEEEVLQAVPISVPSLTTAESSVPLHHLDRVQLPSIHGQVLQKKWSEFLAQVRERNSSIEALLRSSKMVKTTEGSAQIEVYYQFHCEQLRQPKFMRLLIECVNIVTGGTLNLEFTLAERSKNTSQHANVSGIVNEDDTLIQLAKELLV